jgi:putative acetyltransferase
MMPSDLDFEIRPYQPEDREAVVDLFIRINRGLAPPDMRSVFEAYIERSLSEEVGRIDEYYDSGRNRGFWVTTDHLQLLGYFGLEPVSVEAIEVRRMYVDFPFRRRGVARAMLAYAETEARRRGYRKIVLSTSALQRPALALYQSQGYTLLREEAATAASHKTVGQGIVRFHLEKSLPEIQPVQDK